MNGSEREHALSCWPADWPGRQVVDLDNVGDPGYWLEDRLDELAETLKGNEEILNEAAAGLAAAYLNAAAVMSFPVPSDFECTEDDELQMVTEEFRGFLREWRRRIAANKGANR